MSTPSLSTLRTHIFGHPGAHPKELAGLFDGHLEQDPSLACDLAIFAINPAIGIDAQSIAQWEALDEAMVPRLIVVTGLDGSENDFDDAVLLANRVFDQTITPFLVLHDDSGIACALISLSDLSIRDYSTTPPTLRDSDAEHKTLVSEFQSEYLDQMELMGEDAFGAGLVFPAVPIWIDRKIGIDIVINYIESLKN